MTRVWVSPFRRLRAAAITSWLQDGRSLDYCARTAGNSQAVIEKHYKGVLDDSGYEASRPLPKSACPKEAAGEFAGADLTAMPDDRLVEMQLRLSEELGRRLAASSPPVS